MIDDSKEFCPAVIVMAKAPRPGEAKTRLQPFLNAKQAGELAACFFQDTVTKIKQIAPNLIIAYSPNDGREFLETLSPGKKSLWIEQQGEDLGKRLESVIEYAEKMNFRPIITIGTDSPTFPAEYLLKAIESLESKSADIVLGEAKDGGFYLIGLQKSVPNLFEGIAWSTPKVFGQTSDNAERAGLARLLKLPVWYDVDTPQDLLFLRDELAANEEIQIRAPATFQWLLSHSFLFA
jgi:rSAM/selenodomain-associated transferase 1